MSIGANGMLTVLDKAPLGALPEGVAFSPNSEYVYIGNYIDKTLRHPRPHAPRRLQWSELLTGIDGASSRPVRRIVLRS